MWPAGSLDRKITFQEKNVAKSASGVPKETWSDYDTQYANMYIRSGSMNNGEWSAQAEISVEWKMRYRDDIDYDMRIKYDGEIYSIEFIEKLGRNEGLRITSKLIKNPK